MVDFLPFHLYFCIYISALSNRLKEGIQIKSSERISITSDEGTSVYKLKIKETLAEDEGLYSLVAVNKEGETRGDIQLSVHCNVFRFLVLFSTNFVNPFRSAEPPTFTGKPKSCFAKGGETAKFEGSVQGIPAPAVSWLKAGEPLEETDRIKMESDTEGKFSLTISDVQESDYAEVRTSNLSTVSFL